MSDEGDFRVPVPPPRLYRPPKTVEEVEALIQRTQLLLLAANIGSLSDNLIRELSTLSPDALEELVRLAQARVVGLTEKLLTKRKKNR